MYNIQTKQAASVVKHIAKWAPKLEPQFQYSLIY